MREHNRVSEEGKLLGRVSTGMADEGTRLLEAAGLAQVGSDRIRTEMCASCACRSGSVPNGCMQTQLDFLKSVHDGKAFLCHAPHDGKLCAGWLRARASHVQSPMPPAVIALLDAWQYSPPDSAP